MGRNDWDIGYKIEDLRAMSGDVMGRKSGSERANVFRTRLPQGMEW